MARRSIGSWILWWVSRCWLVTGLGALAVGLGFAVYTGIFLSRSISAPGRVVRLEPRTNPDDGSVNYLPVFTFTASNGHAYTIAASVASDPPEFEEGQEIRVLYLRSNPQSARVATPRQLWFVTLVLSGLGIFFSVLGYLLFRWERKRMQRRLGVSASA